MRYNLSLIYTLALSQNERSRVESLCESRYLGNRREHCACVCVRGCVRTGRRTEAWGSRDGQHGQGRDHRVHMQALQQDEPLRDPHLRRRGREDETRREDKHLPTDHGKYE